MKMIIRHRLLRDGANSVHIRLSASIHGVREDVDTEALDLRASESLFIERLVSDSWNWVSVWKYEKRSSLIRWYRMAGRVYVLR